jgi:hypothetical protein
MESTLENNETIMNTYSLEKHVEAIELLETAATIIYNLEGDKYQSVYERLEQIILALEIT